MKKNIFIKKTLINALLDSLQASITDQKAPPNTQAVARGYAAVLLSVVNYGYNVANRRELPSSLFPDKESAISPSDLQNEERYVRSEPSHPNRSIFKYLQSALKQIKRKDVDGLIQYIENNKFIEKQKDADAPHRRWLGQWLLPEEVFEHVFSELSLSDVQLVCKILLKVQADSLKSVPKFTPPTDEKSKPGKESGDYQPSNFKTMMQKRRAIAVGISDEIKGQALLPCEAAKSGYPCVTFDLRELAKKCGAKFEEGKPAEKDYDVLNKTVMSYFCGLINYCSMRHYGDNFVWVQPQGSFGSLRPSFSDTGLGFRFSPGLVPDDFKVVMSEAYALLMKHLNQLSSEGQLSSLIKNHAYFGESWTAEDAQLLALTLMTESQNPLAAYLEKLKPFGKKAKVGTVRSQRETLFETARKKIIEHNKSQDSKSAIAGDELLGLRAQMIELAKTFEPVSDFSLASFAGELHNQIMSVVISATGTDYSKVTTDIETLSRLLQIKYELDLVKKREKSELSAEDLLQLEGPSLPPALKRDVSLDTTLSEDTYATRCGMSAYTLAYQAISHAYGDTQTTYSNEELYFEMTSDIFEYIKRIMALQTDITRPATQDNPTMHFADMSQFPTKPCGESEPSVWKDSWDKISAEKRPEILILDLTAASKEDLEFIAQQMTVQPDAKPYIILTFGSDNKFGQMGVDLVSMGEIRVFSKTPSDREKAAHVASLCKSLKEQFAASREITTSARAYRKLIKDLYQRRSLKPENRSADLEVKGDEKKSVRVERYLDSVDRSLSKLPNVLDLETKSSSPAMSPMTRTIRKQDFIKSRRQDQELLESTLLQLTGIFKTKPVPPEFLRELEQLKQEAEITRAEMELIAQEEDEEDQTIFEYSR
jgi:hypothetical protein